MVLGHVIFSFDNKYSMYRNLKLNECDRYSDIYTINKIDPEIKIKTKKHISCTYDNFTIASDQFKAFCVFTGLKYIKCLNWIEMAIELDLVAYNLSIIAKNVMVMNQ